MFMGAILVASLLQPRTLKHLEVDEETMREMHREVEQLAEAACVAKGPKNLKQDREFGL